jgi:hypothetical protein
MAGEEWCSSEPAETVHVERIEIPARTVIPSKGTVENVAEQVVPASAALRGTEAWGARVEEVTSFAAVRGGLSSSSGPRPSTQGEGRARWGTGQTMDRITKSINSGALVACTIVAFLTSHRVGQAFRHEDWLAAPLYGVLLAVLIWLWFRLERQMKQTRRDDI